MSERPERALDKLLDKLLDESAECLEKTSSDRLSRLDKGIGPIVQSSTPSFRTGGAGQLDLPSLDEEPARTQERSTPGCSSGAAKEHLRSKEHSVTEQEIEQWRERLRTAVAETLRVRAAKAALRRHHAQARAYGLQQRHARKLGRPKDKP